MKDKILTGLLGFFIAILIISVFICSCSSGEDNMAIDNSDQKEESGGLYITDDTFSRYFNDIDTNQYISTIEPDVEDANGVFFGLQLDPSYYNLEEWRVASRIPSKERYEKYTTTGNINKCKFFNAGDAAMPIEFIFEFPKQTTNSIKITHNGQKISLSNIVAQNTEDKYFGINTQEFQIIGYNGKLEPTKTYYNDCLTDRQFFLLPVGESQVEFEGAKPIYNRFKYLYL